MIKIGNIQLYPPCILSPMAGVSNLPFRLITRPFGVPLAFTEMIDINSLCHNDKRTLRMISSTPEDKPLGIQLLGNDNEQIIKSIEILNGYEFDVIDFNAACPASKVVRKGKGAALLKNPRKLGNILELLTRYSNNPVTVKIRTGWDEVSVNACEVALRAEDAGISALFIHGRTKVQGYSGSVDYETIKEVKNVLKIPVIASGDNTSIPLIKKMLDETGCDGIAVARGSLGNPWIFREIRRFFFDGTFSGMPDVQERVETMKTHLDLAVRYWGERRGVAGFHKFFIWYTRGVHGIKELRDKAFRTNNLKELLEVIETLSSRHL